MISKPQVSVTRKASVRLHVQTSMQVAPEPAKSSAKTTFKIGATAMGCRSRTDLTASIDLKLSNRTSVTGSYRNIIEEI